MPEAPTILPQCAANNGLRVDVPLQVSNANGVKQQLWGVKLTARAAPGAAVTSEDGSETLGIITSYANLEKEGHFALAYLKCRRQGVQVRGRAWTVDPVNMLAQQPLDSDTVPAQAVPQLDRKSSSHCASSCRTIHAPQQQPPKPRQVNPVTEMLP